MIFALDPNKSYKEVVVYFSKSATFVYCRCKCQWSYNEHKKSVFSVAYLENMRLVASCDSTVHVS